MTGLGLCVLAFAIVRWLSRRSLGEGVVGLLAVGYAYGLERAYVADSGGHFVFDAALIGLFSAELTKSPGPALRLQSMKAENWLLVLLVWPMICMAYSPLVPDSQPFIIQLLGIRDAIFMAPCILIGARFTSEDLAKIAKGAAVLNLIALAFGVAEFAFGVDTFIPRNDVTQAVYVARDIQSGGSLFYRIPATFLDAHVYGGTMVLSLPFLIHGLDAPSPSNRMLAWAGLGAAAMGVFLCGARLPAAMFLVCALVFVRSIRVRASTIAAIAVIGAVVALLVYQNERFQRFSTLSDTEMVRSRIAQSVSMSFVDVLTSYPLGAGFGRAFGTSIPYFLSDTPGIQDQLGLESEYGHIVLEQGIVGLVIWLSLVFYCATRRPGTDAMGGPARAVVRMVVIVAWLSGLVGVGILQAIPETPLMLFGMGLILAKPRAAPFAPSPSPVRARGFRSLVQPRTARALSGGWL